MKTQYDMAIFDLGTFGFGTIECATIYQWGFQLNITLEKRLKFHTAMYFAVFFLCYTTC